MIGRGSSDEVVDEVTLSLRRRAFPLREWERGREGSPAFGVRERGRRE
jgi:hypothetical protein